MEKQRDRFEDWLKNSYRGPREPKVEAELLAAAKVFDAIKESGVLLPEQLKTIVSAAAHSRAIVWMNSVNLLGDLAVQWPIAANAILDMSESRKANVRFNAICCLQSKTPSIVVDSILKAGFTDKSSRVRWKAAQTANELETRNLINDLTVALSKEPEGKTKRSMKFSLLMLRDGYILEQEDGDMINVCVRTDRGGTCGRTFRAEELRAKGIETIVSELRNRRIEQRVAHLNEVGSERTRSHVGIGGLGTRA